MELITRRQRAKDIRDRYVGWLAIGQVMAHEIPLAERLAALGEDPDPDAVNEIRAGHWTTGAGSCDECVSDTDVVSFGDPEGDRESARYRLCPACLLKASLLVDASPAHVFADFLEERGHAEAAKVLREAFPLRAKT